MRVSLLWLWSRRVHSAPDGQAAHWGGGVIPRCSVLIRPTIIKNNRTESVCGVGATQDKRLTLPRGWSGWVWFLPDYLKHFNESVKKCRNLMTICQRLWSLYWSLNIDDKALKPGQISIKIHGGKGKLNKSAVKWEKGLSRDAVEHFFYSWRRAAFCWQLMKIIPHSLRWNNKSVQWKYTQHCFLCLTLNIVALTRSVFTVDSQGCNVQCSLD